MSFDTTTTTTTTPTPSPSPYLQSFISKTLRITTTDTRVFVGELKCTDKAKNLILSQTHEYRYPSVHELAVAAAADVDGDVNVAEEENGEGEGEGADSVMVDLKSRYIGLVVVPGEYIVKVEVEDGPVGRPRF